MAHAPSRRHALLIRRRTWRTFGLGWVGLCTASCVAGCALDPRRIDKAWAPVHAERIHVPLREALESAKQACADATGESKTPGYWSGYGRAFVACMNQRGWIRVGSPL
jgi:hypothetical protein